MFPFPEPGLRPTFEEIFFEHYPRLSEWAMQLTNRNRSDAEDLIQDLYVRIAGAGSVGEHIENAEAYLFSILRNLQYARVRRARTSALDDLSVVDYDSAERSLRAVDRNELLFIREDLQRVCDYLCERKNTSRSASVFILRYFLGYFPAEVMQVIQTTRSAIDKAMRAARTEARLNLERPGFLRQIESDRGCKFRAMKEAEDSQRLFSSLHARIFRSRTGECFAPSVLERVYETTAQGFSTAELAHLVSCPKCLDRANRLLGIPLLSERSPDETIGRDTPQNPGSSAGASPTLVSSRPKRKSDDPHRLRKRMERCLQEVNQHRPARLLIAVDGDIRASQRVTAQLSELRVELRPMERPTFIEVLSEQSICLAFVLVQALTPEGGLQQTRNIRLSDDRTMKVAISFTTESPTVQVVYSDPLIAMEADMEEKGVEDFPGTIPMFQGISSPAAPWRVINTYLAPQLRRWLTRSSFPKMNPLLTGAMLFGLCAVVCFVLWTKSGLQISARTFLTRAEQANASVSIAGQPGVIYQKIRISSAGHTMVRAIYRDPARKRHLKQQPLNKDDQRTKDSLDLAGTSWEEPLSAADFSAWRDRQSAKKDAVTRTGVDLLTLTTSVTPESSIIQESLTVRESDYHPVARTIRMRDQGTVEIAELNYDVMPWGAVNQDWFEPLAGQAATGAPGLHAALHISHVPSDLELDEAELTARVVLNQLQADTGEQIHLARSIAGIEVKGIVDTDIRKQQLISHLALPHVHSSILSVEEIRSRPLTRSAFVKGQPIQTYSVEGQPSALERYLRENNGSFDQLSVISQSLLDGSLRIQQADFHLSELRKRFKEANQLPADQQNLLVALSRKYINAIHAALDENEHTLFAIGLGSSKRAASLPHASSGSEVLDQHVSRYQELCQQLITGGAGEPVSAMIIAAQLEDLGALIRSSFNQIQVAAPAPQN